MVTCPKCGIVIDPGTKCKSCGYDPNLGKRVIAGMDEAKLNKAAEKALKGLVAGSKLSRVERLAGQILASTIRDRDDLAVLIIAGDGRTETLFKRSKMLAERFINWFDGRKGEEEQP